VLISPKTPIQKTPDSPQDGRSPVETVQVALNKGFICLIDKEDAPIVEKFHWRAVKSANCVYAVAKVIKNGKIRYFRMHRLIAETPRDMVCHHLNLNSLDNRRRNLFNTYPKTHHVLHQYHSLQITKPA